MDYDQDNGLSLGILGLILLVVWLFIALNIKIRYFRWRPTHKVMTLVYVLIIGDFIPHPASSLTGSARWVSC